MIATSTVAFDRYRSALTTPSDMQGHVQRLYELAAGNVMEIGVRDGISTSALLYGVENHGGFLWSVDIEDCSRHFPDHPQWRFIKAHSKTDSDYIFLRIPPRLDLLLVDGDHSYQSCMSDLLTYGPRSRVIAVHDTFTPLWPDVKLAVDDYFKQSQHKKVTFWKECYGMAVLE